MHYFSIHAHLVMDYPLLKLFCFISISEVANLRACTWLVLQSGSAMITSSDANFAFFFSDIDTGH